MALTTNGEIPKQPSVYRCILREDGSISLPVPVQQALQLRPGHGVDFRVLEDRVEVVHAWPCCRICGSSKELRLVRPVFVCGECLRRIRDMDLPRPPLPDDMGL